jgi:hypothetical protein
MMGRSGARKHGSVVVPAAVDVPRRHGGPAAIAFARHRPELDQLTGGVIEGEPDPSSPASQDPARAARRKSKGGWRPARAPPQDPCKRELEDGTSGAGSDAIDAPARRPSAPVAGARASWPRCQSSRQGAPHPASAWIQRVAAVGSSSSSRHLVPGARCAPLLLYRRAPLPPRRCCRRGTVARDGLSHRQLAPPSAKSVEQLHRADGRGGHGAAVGALPRRVDGESRGGRERGWGLGRGRGGYKIYEWAIITNWYADHYINFENTCGSRRIAVRVTRRSQKNYTHASHTHIGHTDNKTCKTDYRNSDVQT